MSGLHLIGTDFVERVRPVIAIMDHLVKAQIFLESVSMLVTWSDKSPVLKCLYSSGAPNPSCRQQRRH